MPKTENHAETEDKSMLQKSGVQFGAGSEDCDFSKDNPDFAKRLHKEFLRMAGKALVIPLSDDDFEGLNAAGGRIPHPLEKKGGDLK